MGHRVIEHPEFDGHRSLMRRVDCGQSYSDDLEAARPRLYRALTHHVSVQQSHAQGGPISIRYASAAQSLSLGTWSEPPLREASRCRPAQRGIVPAGMGWHSGGAAGRRRPRARVLPVAGSRAAIRPSAGIGHTGHGCNSVILHLSLDLLNDDRGFSLLNTAQKSIPTGTAGRPGRFAKSM